VFLRLSERFLHYTLKLFCAAAYYVCMSVNICMYVNTHILVELSKLIYISVFAKRFNIEPTSSEFVFFMMKLQTAYTPYAHAHAVLVVSTDTYIVLLNFVLQFYYSS